MLGLKLALRIGRDIIDVMGKLLSKVSIRSTYSENLAGSRSLVTEIDKAGVLDDATILLTPTAYSNTRVHSVKTYTGDNVYDDDIDEAVNGGTWTDNGDGTFTVTGAGYPSVGIGVRDISASYLTDGNSYSWTVDGSNISLAVYDASFSLVASGTSPLYFTATATNRLYISPTDGVSATYSNVSLVDVSSDFDFDRASSATRINSDGLVQDMQSITDVELVQNGDFEELGSELVTNGDFGNGTIGWSSGNSTLSVVDGKLKVLAINAFSYARQDITVASGKTYKITANFFYNSLVGNIEAYDGTTNTISEQLSEDGVITLYVTPSSTNLRLTLLNRNGSSGDFNYWDNISVQQVDPNDRWTLTQATITDGSLNLSTSDGSYTAATQTLGTIGNVYEISLDVSDIVGTISVAIGGGTDVDITTNGTHTVYITSASTTFEIKRKFGITNVSATIDNISVKDITFSEDVDLARINYDSNGENGHWLLEPTSTNVITYSQDLSQWTSDDVTVIDNNAISPDGTQNASKIELDSGTSIKRISLGSMPTSSVNRSFSVFIKANSDFTGAVQLVHSGDLQGFANFDLSDGTVGSTGSKTTANIVSYANDWYRCTAIFDSTNTFASTVYLWVQDNDSGSYGGSTSATGSIFAYGFQYEALSYATSYIPTYGSTVTRATETLTGSGNSTLINSTEGVLYAEIAALENTNSDKNISISDGTNSNRVGIYYYGNTMSAVGYLGGANQFYLATSIPDVKEFIKVAIKYKNNDFALWIDGVQISTDTSGTVPSGLNSLQFDNGNGGGDFYGNCKALTVFDRALTDRELEDLTS